MSVIYNDLRKQENKTRRWQMHTGRSISPTLSRLQTQSTFNDNRDETDQQNGTHGTSAGKKSVNPRNSRLSESDNVKWQAFCYVGSFFLPWTFLTIVRGMQLFVDASKIPCGILLTGVILCPSQGFFNLLVYIRPKYKKHRLQHPEVGCFTTFLRVHPFFISRKRMRAKRKSVQSSVTRSVRSSSGSFLNGLAWITPDLVLRRRSSARISTVEGGNAVPENMEHTNENDRNAVDSDASIYYTALEEESVVSNV